MLETAAQDVRYALRQLGKTPAFTTTVLLTLALGIGANAAIFTLVNSVLMKDLPVTDPRTLVRIGDDNDCCVNDGTKDTGDSTLFSTGTYAQLKKNLPEFEELAAMQAGFGDRPLIARRDIEAHNAVWGIGAVAGDDWPLRRDCLFRGTARTGDRHPHGAPALSAVKSSR